MFEAEIMITGYTIVVAFGSIGISKFLFRKKTKKFQKEINNLKDSLIQLENENKKLKANDDTN